MSNLTLPTLQECYEIMQENCGMGVGDEVRVLRKAENLELGWSTSWVNKMNDAIGSVCEIMKIDSNHGMLLDSNGYNFYFPFFVLEKIERVREVTMQEIEDKFGYEVKIIGEE